MLFWGARGVVRGGGVVLGGGGGAVLGEDVIMVATPMLSNPDTQTP